MAGDKLARLLMRESLNLDFELNWMQRSGATERQQRKNTGVVKGHATHEAKAKKNTKGYAQREN
jgi:hypothetical protein